MINWLIFKLIFIKWFSVRLASNLLLKYRVKKQGIIYQKWATNRELTHQNVHKTQSSTPLHKTKRKSLDTKVTSAVGCQNPLCVEVWINHRHTAQGRSRRSGCPNLEGILTLNLDKV